MNQYLKIFKFLWYIKRIENLFNLSWKDNLNITLKKQFETLIHFSHFVRLEMRNFINNLQYYLLYEVFESSWNQLVQKMKEIEEQDKGLDDLIQAHSEYISGLLSKTFIEESNDLYLLILSVLKCISSYVDIQNVIFKDSENIERSQLLVTKMKNEFQEGLDKILTFLKDKKEEKYQLFLFHLDQVKL